MVQLEEESSDRYKTNQKEALDQHWISTGSALDQWKCRVFQVQLPRKGGLHSQRRASQGLCVMVSQVSSGVRLGGGPNDASVRNTVKKFFRGYQRVTKTKIPDQLQTDVYTVKALSHDREPAGALS